MRGFLRAVVVLICVALICAVLLVCLGFAQDQTQAGGVKPPLQGTSAPDTTTFQISGTVKTGKTPLPGVTVTAANTLTGKKLSVATAIDGTFLFKGVPRGRYVVKVEFMGFATLTQEIVLNPENPTGQSRSGVGAGFATTRRRAGEPGERSYKCQPRFPKPGGGRRLIQPAEKAEMGMEARARMTFRACP